VEKIGMDKPAGKKPVELIVFGYCRRVEDQVVHDLIIIKSSKGNYNSDDDNDQGYGHAVNFRKDKVMNFYS
jgi:hypothetical protein